MNIYDMYGTSKTLEQDGVDFEIMPGVRFKVARAGGKNKRYESVLAELAKPHMRQIQNETMDRDLMEELGKKAFIRGCLLSWEGVTNHDGGELEFSEANAMTLFDELPDLYNTLKEAADKISNYRSEVIEEVAGKLEDT